MKIIQILMQKLIDFEVRLQTVGRHFENSSFWGFEIEGDTISMKKEKKSGIHVKQGESKYNFKNWGKTQIEKSKFQLNSPQNHQFQSQITKIKS